MLVKLEIVSILFHQTVPNFDAFFVRWVSVRVIIAYHLAHAGSLIAHLNGAAKIPLVPHEVLVKPLEGRLRFFQNSHKALAFQDLLCEVDVALE